MRVSAGTVRIAIARAILGDAISAAPARLGSVELQPHQSAAVARIERALRELGGALLADETGLGKTYVALAVARSATRPLIVAPAALRPMWTAAMSETECSGDFVSIESLGRRESMPAADHDLVIVDEAHHARNPATVRYRTLARLTARARVLLLSATPVHNSPRDLHALLALFLGERAAAVDPVLAARCVIRRAHADAGGAMIPRVLPLVALALDHDDRTLDAILALPPPLPPSDGGEAAILLSYSLVRQWASSHGALRGALRRRLARAIALVTALDSGLYPSTADLAAWTYADSALQLALPGLVVHPHAGSRLDDDDRIAMAAAVEDHTAAVRALLRRLDAGADTDRQRAQKLDELRAVHPGERIVAFTQFAETAGALFAHLRHRPRVCVLTAAGAEVAGGSISRGEALAGFATRAHRAARPRAGHEIDLLIATDLLSEGVNLQDAAVVVHLDLPWTPARLEQRVGRVARLGSVHPRVHVYSFPPPASADSILYLEDRLRAKLGAAERTVGIVGAIVPTLFPGDLGSGAGSPEPPDAPAASVAAPRAVEAIRRLAADWLATGDDGGEGAPEASRSDTLDTCASRRRGGSHLTIDARVWVASGSADRGASDRLAPPAPLVAAVESPIGGWIAVIDADRDADTRDSAGRIVAHLGAGATDDPETLLRALRLAVGTETAIPDHLLAATRVEITRWLTAHRLRADLSIDAPRRANRRVIERIATITRRAPKHLRPAIASLAATARRSVTASFGAGAERVLEELAGAPMADEAWLRAVRAFGELHARDLVGPGAERLRALLLLVPCQARRLIAPA
jgi:superfamily II DNA or RNA helicase